MADIEEPIIPTDGFAHRHLGPSSDDIIAMLEELGIESLDALIEATVPDAIHSKRQLDLGQALSEQAALAKLRGYARQNQVCKSYIGMGYSPTFTPPVIQRNILENPGWYTQYTP